jgi:hypothetical protein
MELVGANFHSPPFSVQKNVILVIENYRISENHV